MKRPGSLPANNLMKRREKEKPNHLVRLGMVIKYLLLALGAVFMIIPFLWTVTTSLSPDSVLISFDIIPKEITFENYVRAWNFPRVFDESVNFGTFFLNSLIVAFFTTCLGILVDSLAGFILARRNIPGKDLLFYLALMTLMIPFHVVAVPMFLFVRNLGWLNTFQGQIVPFIASGFGLFMFKQYFQSIPLDLEDSAKIDGCSLLRIYFSIMLPLAKPVIGTMLIFKAMWSWNLFLWPLLIINDIQFKTVQLALTMFRGLNVTQWGLLCAGITIATLPIIILYLLMQNMFEKGITMGAVKG